MLGSGNLAVNMTLTVYWERSNKNNQDTHTLILYRK